MVAVKEVKVSTFYFNQNYILAGAPRENDKIPLPQMKSYAAKV